jgi:hypothetical protein
MEILFPMFIVISIVQITISIPLILEMVKPNPWYGFRVRATLETPDIWYAVNSHVGWRLLVSGIVFLITTLVLRLVPGINLDAYALIILFVFVGVTMVGLGQSAAYLRSLTKKNKEAQLEK